MAPKENAGPRQFFIIESLAGLGTRYPAYIQQNGSYLSLRQTSLQSNASTLEKIDVSPTASVEQATTPSSSDDVPQQVKLSFTELMEQDNFPFLVAEDQQMATSYPEYMRQNVTPDSSTSQQRHLPITTSMGQNGLLPDVYALGQSGFLNSEPVGQVTHLLEPQQTGTNVPICVGQDVMSATNTSQQQNISPAVYMGQEGNSTTLSLPATAQNATKKVVVPTPPITPPIEPKQKTERAPRGGVTKPRDYRRSLKSCERCTKNKLKCDNNPEGCQRCKNAGEECCDIDPLIKGRMRRAEANSLLDQMQALLAYTIALESKCQAHGVELPERPKGVPTPENASWLAASSASD